MSLTTTSSNDVIVVVVQSCDACQISVTDSQGLTYNQRTSYTDGSSGKSLSELYTVAQSPVESDNITVTSSGQYYLTSVEILALRGADTSIIFDPGSPVTATCWSPSTPRPYPGNCSLAITTSTEDFIIATVSVGDDGPCTVLPEYTLAFNNGNFDTYYTITGGSGTSIEFTCLDNDSQALILDAVKSATGPQAHPPIMISGNDQFTPSNGVVSGSGTSTDPYIIQGWDISTNQSDGIQISNTNAYFVIRSVYIHSDTSGNYNGISLDNVRNGAVDSSLFFNDSYGVSIVQASNIAITHNIMQYDSHGTIVLENSTSVEIAGNDLSNNPNIDGQGRATLYAYNTNTVIVTNNALLNDEYDSISFSSSAAFTITNNSIRLNSLNGIAVDSSSNFTLQNNRVGGNMNANIAVSNSGNFTLNSNSIFCGATYRDVPCRDGLTATGISITSSDSFRMYRNFIVPGNAGISLDAASNATLVRNVIYQGLNGTALIAINSGTVSIIENTFGINNVGVELENSTSFNVYHNNFNANSIQAIDNQGTNNSWDNGYSSGGNWWSDYGGSDQDSDGIGDTPYTFNSNQDNYPLMSPYPTQFI